MRGALNRRFQRAQRGGVERLHTLGRTQALPFGRGNSGFQAVQHALRRTQISPVRHQQAAAHRDLGRPRQGRRDARPQRQRAPAERGHGGLGVVQFRQGTQHACRRERRGRGNVRVGRLAACDGLLACGRVEHAHTMTGLRQAPGQQAAQQASAGNADGESIHPCSLTLRRRSMATLEGSNPSAAKKSAAPSRPARSTQVTPESSPVTASTKARPTPR